MNRKKIAKKAKKKGNASFYTKVTKNIEVSENGIYRVRKMINGLAYSSTFNKISQAKRWLKSI